MTKKNLPATKDKEKSLKESLEHGTGRIPKKGGYYPVAPGKFEADAYRVQEDANERKLKTVIIRAEQTDRYAEAIAEAEAEEGVIVQAIVHHDFDTIMGKKIMEMYKKALAGKIITFGERENKKRIEVFKDLDNPFMMSETGKMIPNLTGQGIAKILDDMLRFRDFSLRDATTKAMRVAQLKALNKDWRDDEEVKAEEDEVKNVNKGKKIEKVSQSDIDEKEKEEETAEETETQDTEQEREEKLKERREEIKNVDTDKEEQKEIIMETLDATDDLTRAEIREMSIAEIGRAVINKLKAEKKELTGGEFGKVIMPWKQKRWISGKKYEALREWFLETMRTE